eukprot:CAMPEP_0196596630 /NCGR_PEP_ID=MMETSP1081-20130531/87107_1 /TAXON_ID=36882 /ORGANISM="Pyramimonas amylifera, Strain CCMP720" /LENGTH=145 /DNA_ID=CAMNT_0041921731 /DNA_START=258 /DNA_END=692 /DNA_ORIENTATION=+
MWSSEKMIQYLEEETAWGGYVWEDRVVPAMKDITMRIMSAAARRAMTPREGSFELFGMDFMLDADLRVWLCEVNESPDLRPRTPAKAAACGRMLDGLIQILLDSPATSGQTTAPIPEIDEMTGFQDDEKEESTDIGGWELLDDYW